MNVSNQGRQLLMQWEGVKEKTYLDSAGLPTIGCGHLLTKDELRSGKIKIGNEFVKYENGLTNLQIDQLLHQDLHIAEETVSNNVSVGLTQYQFDALCSFVFNVGTTAFINSTLLKVLNSKDFDAVQNQLRRWNKSGGRIVAGLINRREKEISLFNSGFA